jgi:hypothetical protein
MIIEQRAFSILVGLSFLATVLELVRRKKLREEYAWFWLLTGATIFLLAVFEPLVLFLARLVRAQAPTSIIYMLGILFLLLLNLHFSVSISTLKTRLKDLTQKIAISESRISESSFKDKKHNER